MSKDVDKIIDAIQDKVKCDLCKDMFIVIKENLYGSFLLCEECNTQCLKELNKLNGENVK